MNPVKNLIQNNIKSFGYEYSKNKKTFRCCIIELTIQAE
jgi:hypothetical protein